MTLPQPNIPIAGQTCLPRDLSALAADILRHAGMDADDAEAMADILVYAQECGIESHGLMHLGAYLKGFANGALNPRPQFQVLSTLPAAATLDADRAPGVLAGLAACDEAVRRAAALGVGVVAVRNSAHFGAASAFVDRMVARGMVGLVMSNASPTMAPRGAKTAMLGTNPIACGFPRRDGPPVIIDLATTAGSRARIRKAAATGEAIPGHWALDADGHPTTDAKAALDGTMQALGGGKGTALALMVELFCVGLSGGTTGRSALPPQEASDAPRGISHMFVAMDASAFGAAEGIAARISDIAKSIESAAATDPGKAPRMPGARAAESRAAAARDGIIISPLLSQTLAEADQTARHLASQVPSRQKKAIS